LYRARRKDSRRGGLGGRSDARGGFTTDRQHSDAAGFLVPKVEPDKAIDLREYCYENRGGFFGTGAAFTALMSVENWPLTGRGSPAPVTATFVVTVSATRSCGRTRLFKKAVKHPPSL